MDFLRVLSREYSYYCGSLTESVREMSVTVRVTVQMKRISFFKSPIVVREDFGTF